MSKDVTFRVYYKMNHDMPDPKSVDEVLGGNYVLFGTVQAPDLNTLERKPQGAVRISEGDVAVFGPDGSYWLLTRREGWERLRDVNRHFRASKFASDTGVMKTWVPAERRVVFGNRYAAREFKAEFPEYFVLYEDLVEATNE